MTSTEPTEDEMRAGTEYPSCSAWALAKLEEHPRATQTARLILLVLAADADRALHSPNGYNGTGVIHLCTMTGLGLYGLLTVVEGLQTVGLVEMREPTDPEGVISYRLPARFLPYMRD